VNPTSEELFQFLLCRSFGLEKSSVFLEFLVEDSFEYRFLGGPSADSCRTSAGSHSGELVLVRFYCHFNVLSISGKTPTFQYRATLRQLKGKQGLSCAAKRRRPGSPYSGDKLRPTGVRFDEKNASRSFYGALPLTKFCLYPSARTTAITVAY
jgi:hypothetical protein